MQVNFRRFKLLPTSRMGTMDGSETRRRGSRSRGGSPRGRGILALAAALAVSTAEVPGAELPQQAEHEHLGVKECAGAPCHGNAAPIGVRVFENEHTTWLRHDAHAQAYATLESELSRRIAKNLRLPAPAHESDLCLDCHADNVPESLRGERFVLEDGVGCEACHGGSENWLTEHSSDVTDHARNVERGMYPTDDPVARAALCLSCHFGNSKKLVNHRMMGAGHPRMSFELDTFSAVQPAHYRIDGDYRERGKNPAEGIQVWAVGQVVAARALLDVLTDRGQGRDGIWPELVLFDCHACHHPLTELRWRPRRTTGLWGHPGVPRLNDSSLLMARHAAATVDPASAEAMRKETLALHAALSAGRGKPKRLAAELRDRLEDLIPRVAAGSVDTAGVQGIGAGVAAEGASGEYRDYAAAEQATMALQSVVSTLHGRGELTAGELQRLNAHMEALLAVTESPRRYRPEKLVPIFRDFERELR